MLGPGSSYNTGHLKGGQQGAQETGRDDAKKKGEARREGNL